MRSARCCARRARAVSRSVEELTAEVDGTGPAGHRPGDGRSSRSCRDRRRVASRGRVAAGLPGPSAPSRAPRGCGRARGPTRRGRRAGAQGRRAPSPGTAGHWWKARRIPLAARLMRAEVVLLEALANAGDHVQARLCLVEVVGGLVRRGLADREHACQAREPAERAIGSARLARWRSCRRCAWPPPAPSGAEVRPLGRSCRLLRLLALLLVGRSQVVRLVAVESWFSTRLSVLGSPSSGCW